MATPVLLKVLGSLGVMLVVQRLRRKLMVAVLASTLMLAVWSGHSVSAMAGIVVGRLGAIDNLFLMVIIFEVIWLSSQMSCSGAMRELVGGVRSRIPQRAAVAALPALIGMLPMPGGAVFSAPLVDDCDPDQRLAPLLKTQINYWFRHVWEYWWPLYPGVLLAIDISGLEIWQFILVQLPLSLMSIGLGYWYLLRHIPPGAQSPSATETATGPSSSLLPPLMPILMTVGVYALIRLFFPACASASKYLPMIAGLACGMAVLQVKRPLTSSQWLTILRSRKTLALAVIVTAVRVYGAFIEAELPSGVMLVEQMRGELQAWGLPVLLIIMAIPFISGLATGLAIGFVGASFPIIFSLLGPDPSLQSVLVATVLGFGFGYMGMILSPVHICLIVTNEHFKTELLHSIRGLARPAAIMLGGVLVYAWLIRALT